MIKDQGAPHYPNFGTRFGEGLDQALTLKPDFMAARQKLSRLIQLQPANAEMPTRNATAQQASVSASDAIVTGSVLGDNTDLVMRKKELPSAVSPPSGVQQASRPYRPASISTNRLRPRQQSCQ